MKVSGSPLIWDVARVGSIIYYHYDGVYYKSISKVNDNTVCFILLDIPLNEIELKMKFKDEKIMIDNELKYVIDIILSNKKGMKHSLIGLNTK